MLTSIQDSNASLAILGLNEKCVIPFCIMGCELRHSTRVALPFPRSLPDGVDRGHLLAALLASIQAAYWLAIHTFYLLPFSSPQMVEYVHMLLVMMLIQGCATARHQRIETS